MSNPRRSLYTSILNNPTSHLFIDKDVQYLFYFNNDLSVRVLLTKQENRDENVYFTHDTIEISKSLIHEHLDFRLKHRWLSENFRQHLLKFINLPAFF